ncbi:hypothetical protein AK88_05297 [Plasmodium fragile]|uniref:Schizont-infected cell agglutination C-terminal domain-containing protein n=1 Tax=Plasmodium fragile TaxID=5857 RepID=A0A0D9QDH0_PLAFR|nr:uncharacterized protein AK88_05297 [Plasmodium fragile]KJP85075.1 hypothetical protein AK88_05297 [Plasmodium fragile]
MGDSSMIEAYGSNCNNDDPHYWEQRKSAGQGSKVMMTREDKIVCMLMTGALAFVNGWGTVGKPRQGIAADEKKAETFIKCALANMYMYILEETRCDAKWGIDYAWYAMNKLEGLHLENLIKEQKCKRGADEYGKKADARIRGRIKNFLKSNGGMFAGIQGGTVKTECETKLTTHKEEEGKGHTEIQVKTKDAKYNENGKQRKGSSTTSKPATATGSDGHAAKPVAVKPASPPSPTPGTRTTRLGPGDDCQGDKVWEWKHREIYVQLDYSADQWNKMKDVLDDFIKYLQDKNDNFDGYGANCNNAGWNDFTQGQHHTGQTVADMMRCRIMSGALWFANGWGIGDKSGKDKTGDEQKLYEQLRCEVAHVFGHLLKNMYCKDKTPWPRGVEYAYTALQKMGRGEHGKDGLQGPVVEGRCTMCGYKGYTHHVQAVNLRIAQWLMWEGGLLGEIQKLEQEMPCEQHWQKYITHGAKAGDSIETILTTPGKEEKKKLDTAIVETAQKAFEGAKAAVERELEKLKAPETDRTRHRMREKGQDDGKDGKDGKVPATPVAAKQAEAGSWSGTRVTEKTKYTESGASNTPSAASGRGTVTRHERDAAMDFLVKVLVSYINRRRIGGEDGEQNYYDKFWADMKNVYAQFVRHMVEQDQGIPYGELCETAERDHNEDHKFTGDRVVCEFMLRALYFKHGLHVPGAGRSVQGPEHHATKAEPYMTCIIVNVFIQHILGEVCLETRGAQYAEKAIYELLKPDSGFQENATCDGVNLRNTTVAGGNLTQRITAWIKNEKIKWGDTASAGTLDNKCTAWTGEAQDKTGKKNEAVEEEEIKQRVEAAISTVKHTIQENEDDIKTKVVQRIQQTLSTQNSSAQAPPADAADTQSREPTAAAAKPAATKPATTKPVAQPDGAKKEEKTSSPSPSPGLEPVGRADPSAAENGGSQPQAPESPVLPARPPPPPPPPSRTPSTENNGKTQDKSDHKATGSSGAAGVGTSVSTTTDPELGTVTITTKITTIPYNPTTGVNPADLEKMADEQEKGKMRTQKPDSVSTGDPQRTTVNVQVEPPVTPVPELKSPVPSAQEETKEPSVSTAVQGEATTANSGQPKSNEEGNTPQVPVPGSGGGLGGAPPSGGGATGAAPSSPGSTGHHTPGSSGSASPSTPHTPQIPSTAQNDQPAQNKPGEGAVAAAVLTWQDLIPYTPAIIPAVVGIGIIAFFLWKYFAHLAPRRRTYRTVRDVPSPPLDEEILQHLQRGAAPPDYGYTMVKVTQPASISGRARPPRVNRRTIIELHLEVLNECEATEWENVKDDYLHTLVEQVMGANNGHSSYPASSSNEESTTHHSTSHTRLTRDPTETDSCPPNEDDPDPPTDSDEPDAWSCMDPIQLPTDPCQPHDPDVWSCMETIQVATDPCPPNAEDSDPWKCMETIQLATDPSASNEEDPDPWSCMETMQFATDTSPPNEDDPWSCIETIELEEEGTPALFPYSSPGNESPIPYHSNWINWIDRNKRILRACTTQPWFLQLKSDWKQYLREHIAANEDNGVYGQRALGQHANIPSVEIKKDAWKQWVVKQHNDMAKYIEKDWFRPLLNSVEEETESHKGEVPGVQKHLEVDKVMAAEDVLRLRHVPRTQLHKQPYMNKPLTAKIWILILALVIEQCKLESRLQETELYVDALLDKL